MGGSYDQDYDSCESFYPPSGLAPSAAHMSCDACSHHIRIGDDCAVFWRGDYDDMLALNEEDSNRTWDTYDPDELIRFVQCKRCWLIYKQLQEYHEAKKTEHWVDPELNCGMHWNEFFEGDMPDEITELAFKTAEEVSR